MRHFTVRNNMRSQTKMRTVAKDLVRKPFATDLKGFTILIEVLIPVGDGLNSHECMAFRIWKPRISVSSIISPDEA